MRIFDSHAHYNDAAFDTDAAELLRKLHDNEHVEKILDVGSDIESSRKAANFAKEFDFVYYAAGIHPEYAAKAWNDENVLPALRALCRDEKCVAVGEIGLDYYYGKDDVDAQKALFETQLRLARELSLPVIVHDREAHADSFDTVCRYPDVCGVFHCYSGSFEIAKELLVRGWYLSFNGIVTFKNARKTVEVLERLRNFENGKYLTRLLVETDCPYLAPEPHRGTRNHSGNIAFTAKRCAEVLRMSTDEFCELTYQNACRLFSLKDGQTV